MEHEEISIKPTEISPHNEKMAERAPSVSDRTFFKFLTNARRNITPFDPAGYLPGEVEVARVSREATRAMIQQEWDKLQDRFTPEEKLALDDEALEDLVRGYRAILKGRTDEEVEQEIQKVRDRWRGQQ